MGRIYREVPDAEFSDIGRDGPNLVAALVLLVLAALVAAVLTAPWWVPAWVMAR
ncbi:MAG: hypothetical protein GX557_02765 [Chloroflexi bacterium]|nr:hypothetical protein [Chloroflexota bacterium]